LLPFGQAKGRLKEKKIYQTAGQRKGLWAEASFCLEFCFLLVKQKEE
jgi:hypothetical protein